MRALGRREHLQPARYFTEVREFLEAFLEIRRSDPPALSPARPANEQELPDLMKQEHQDLLAPDTGGHDTTLTGHAKGGQVQI